tara:strand:- start:256 stop:444 length:189 start_codon:yes stop_codon:yes gene_type:complete
MAKIELSDEERRALAQLIDIAVKSQGIPVAKAATHLFDKIAVDEPQLEAVEAPEEGDAEYAE